MKKSEKDDMAKYLFCQGTNFRAYDYLGAHRLNSYKKVFRVWAPRASKVSIQITSCQFTGIIEMTKIQDSGIFELKLHDDLIKGEFKYKYIIENLNYKCYKTDPFGFFCERPPNTATIYRDIDKYKWHDKTFLRYRQKNYKVGYYDKPINIYEVHLGSFMRKEDGGYFSYREIANELAPYVKQMGYTHIEIMPIMEHPYDGSWGYQVGCYYAPTSRYGDVYDFMEFIDIMHGCGIGVILDWVPAHFPKDESGLINFDGDYLYEYSSDKRRENKGWGTRCFDLSRNEVQSFLVSNADFWIRKYHIDGIRVDAVSAMIYRDFDRRDGEWEANEYGGNLSLDGEAFLKKLCGHIRGEFPDVLLIAEESSNYSNLTGTTDQSVGFSMKWDMGWMNDTLEYISMDPIYRKYHHDKLTFPMMYSFSEKFILPISHDEVVHGKKSLIERMPLCYNDKFSGVRALMGYMMTRPSKKLIFMGCEIGQFSEWDYRKGLDFFLLDYELHEKLQYFFAKINHFYLENNELWEDDCSFEGFKWICADDNEKSIISYRRIGKDRNKELYIAINFTPVDRNPYRLYVAREGLYNEVFNSDKKEFGGLNRENAGNFACESADNGILPYFIDVRLPPLSFVIFRRLDNS